MAFEAYGANKNESKGKEVDYDALNKYVVETAKLEERETLIGYISAIVDLGEQEQGDAEMEFKGSTEDEAAEIEKNSNTYFKDGFNEKRQPCRLKCWPQRAVQSVAVAVDFPEIVVDKGQFFGNSKPMPLRIWMGGSFYIPDQGMVIARPTPLKITKSTGFWSFDKKHLFHKMAVSGKMIKADEAFLPQNIDQLLGKSFQFEAQIFFKENKGKQYYTEYIKFVGGLGRGQVAHEPESEPILIQFNQPNSEEALKELRKHVINTIKRANNFEGSAIEQQLKANSSEQGSKQEQEAPEAPVVAKQAPAKPAVAAKPVKAPKEAVKPTTGFDDLDDDIPF